MKKKIFFIIMILLFFSGTVIYAKKITNNNVSVRFGAGAFYPVKTVLNKGDHVTILKNGNFWIKVRTKFGKTGWVSSNAFKTIKLRIDYGLISRDMSGRSVSKILVTAAVKRFFENKIKNSDINKNILERPFTRYVDSEIYLRFKNDTFRNRRNHGSFQRNFRLRHKGSIQIDERLFVLSSYIIARLCSEGIMNDPRKLAYINSVAQLVGESTEFFDLPITVHVARTNRIFANATPIGDIVISEGMLKVIQSENELACLIGHEISHVTLCHGTIEMKKRGSVIKAENAFSELDKETKDSDPEMDDFANEMYERSVKGRKAEYKDEADIRGLIYARRAGYDVNGLPQLLKRIKGYIPVSMNPDESSHWLPFDIEKRIQKLEYYIKKNMGYQSQYKKFRDRYMSYMGR